MVNSLLWNMLMGAPLYRDSGGGGEGYLATARALLARLGRYHEVPVAGHFITSFAAGC